MTMTTILVLLFKLDCALVYLRTIPYSYTFRVVWLKNCAVFALMMWNSLYELPSFMDQPWFCQEYYT